jgi:GGDEF domain-containing protein
VEIVLRYSGDEFVTLQVSIENVEVLAIRVSTAMREQFCIGDICVNIGCSIRAASSDALSNNASFDSMISVADLERYKSKAAGKSVF